uniref:Uncharacterized protein n=1 Tax=Hyaloperonospora arabidopsidis (strain Emoy2) TaxID=559515 RepID=M4B9M0_HYAAE
MMSHKCNTTWFQLLPKLRQVPVCFFLVSTNFCVERRIVCGTRLNFSLDMFQLGRVLVRLWLACLLCANKIRCWICFCFGYYTSSELCLDGFKCLWSYLSVSCRVNKCL